MNASRIWGGAAKAYTVDIICDGEVLVHHHSLYNKKDDDTFKEIQEMLVKQQVAKTAQDIFMGIRFMESSSQRTHDGLW